jgi:hypothetical protein
MRECQRKMHEATYLDSTARQTAALRDQNHHRHPFSVAFRFCTSLCGRPGVSQVLRGVRGDVMATFLSDFCMAIVICN